MDRGAWQASAHGDHKELDMTKHSTAAASCGICVIVFS